MLGERLVQKTAGADLTCNVSVFGYQSLIERWCFAVRSCILILSSGCLISARFGFVWGRFGCLCGVVRACFCSISTNNWTSQLEHRESLSEIPDYTV